MCISSALNTFRKVFFLCVLFLSPLSFTTSYVIMTVDYYKFQLIARTTVLELSLEHLLYSSIRMGIILVYYIPFRLASGSKFRHATIHSSSQLSYFWYKSKHNIICVIWMWANVLLFIFWLDVFFLHSFTRSSECLLSDGGPPFAPVKILLLAAINANKFTFFL